jgi:hypothetical protein
VEAGERAREGVFRAVADAFGNGGDRFVGVAEPPRGEVQPPAGEVGERRFANQAGEAPGESRPGHGDLGGDRLGGPEAVGMGVHAGEGGADLAVAQCS